MVFAYLCAVVSEPDSAPLSPEQVQFANLKSAQLDRALGLSPDKNPTDKRTMRKGLQKKHLIGMMQQLHTKCPTQFGHGHL